MVEQPMMNIEPLIRVENLSRSYAVGSSRIQALRGLNLTIPAGVFAAIKGRSGSGKTTLLNMIGGLDKPTEGKVFVFGKDLSTLSNREITDLRRRQIGFVFQSFAIMPILSAVENVELMLRIGGIWRGRRERALRCLEIVGLADWANHRPWELSGGQQKRVAIARALATKPLLILADEPTGELDSTSGRQILALFRYIVEKEKLTIVTATHDPMVEEYAHIVYELGDGQVRSMRIIDPELKKKVEFA